MAVAGIHASVPPPEAKDTLRPEDMTGIQLWETAVEFYSSPERKRRSVAIN
jgi:hypothetical protein